MTKQFSNYSDLITFTRASGGHALRPVSYGDELVTNGTFDSDISGWTDSLSTSTWDSAGYISVSYFTSVSGPYQSFSTEVGKIYAVSGTLISTTGTGASGPLIRAGSGSSPDAGIIDSNTLSAGETATISFVATSTTSYVYLRNASEYTSKWDNISVKEVLFDQPDGTLTLFEHPDNVPRVEYDADGNRLGLLVEESRTNLITYSEDFSKSAWIKLAAVVTASAVSSPDRSANAFLFRPTSTSPRLLESVSSTTANHAHSVYAKAGGKDLIQVGQYNGSTYEMVLVNLNNGAIVTNTGTASVTEMPDGWYRISVAGTSTNTSRTLNISCGDVGDSYSATSISTTPDGVSGVYIYGAQVEEGSFPTSYIKSNSGSTTTRSADVASIPVADFGYNQSAGSLVVEAKRFGTSSEFPRIAQLTDGTSSERISVSIYGAGNTAYANVYDGGVSQASLNEATSTGADTYAKLGFGFANNDFAFAVDGVVEGTDTSGSVPDNISEMLIGDRVSADQQLNGHIKSIKYFPRRLTNAQLQALTS